MTSSELFAQIRLVLVHPSDPGNIGATARAMKTMGLKRLYLVDPEAFPHPYASVRASNALDILADTVVVDTLEEAICDCHLVLGTSTRRRELNWTSLTPYEAAERIIGNTAQEIAILFGRERCGLTNQELQRCHSQIIIPTNPDYPSLNLAAAAQIICYELYKASLSKGTSTTIQRSLANVAQQEHFYEHLNSLLLQIGFLKTFRSRKVMERLRRLFSRVLLEEREIKILRGILSAIQKK